MPRSLSTHVAHREILIRFLLMLGWKVSLKFVDKRRSSLVKIGNKYIEQNSVLMGYDAT
jgi:ribulose bisphosphate carboxylase small subunit